MDLFRGLPGRRPAGWGTGTALRLTMAVGAGLFLATSLLIGLITTPWQFVVAFGILMSAALAIFQVPLVSAITLWFHRHLGLAMGFCSPPRVLPTCCLRR